MVLNLNWIRSFATIKSPNTANSQPTIKSPTISSEFFPQQKMQNLKRICVVMFLSFGAFIDHSTAQQEVKTNCYQLLNLSAGACNKQIKKKFREFALINHPDKRMVKDKDDATKTFEEASACHDILLDQHQRQLHDLHLILTRRMSNGEFFEAMESRVSAEWRAKKQTRQDDVMSTNEKMEEETPKKPQHYLTENMVLIVFVIQIVLACIVGAFAFARYHKYLRVQKVNNSQQLLFQGNESIKNLRKFVKSNRLQIKLAGKGRNKSDIIRDINEILSLHANYVDRFKRKIKDFYLFSWIHAVYGFSLLHNMIVIIIGSTFALIMTVDCVHYDGDFCP
eukprot:725567_1